MPERTDFGDEEKVILGDEVRLYRARATLGYLDTPGLDYRLAKIVWDQLGAGVPVTDDTGKRLGYGSLWVLGEYPKVLVADVSIDYASEARLLAEQGVLWAFPECHLVVDPVVQDLALMPIVKALLVTGIKLLQKSHADRRVGPFQRPTP